MTRKIRYFPLIIKKEEKANLSLDRKEEWNILNIVD
jgi:hypothetical protein